MSKTRVTVLADDVYRMDDAIVYGVKSKSTDRIHQVTYEPRSRAAQCDGPHCHGGQFAGRNCRHVQRVLDIRGRP